MIIIFIVLLLIGLATMLPLVLLNLNKKKPDGTDSICMKAKRDLFVLFIERVAILRWNTTGITIAGTAGIPGSGANQFNSPWGLAITRDYTLYVADTANNRIQKYTRDSSIGITVAGSATGIGGVGNVSLRNPSTILVDSDENIYISDSFNQRIQFWRHAASFGMTIAGSGRDWKESLSSIRFVIPYYSRWFR